MALKPAEFYGNIAALKAKCPPGSSQAQFYTDIAEMVLTIINDGDVTGTPPLGSLVAPTGGGPVVGIGKIV